MTVADVFAAGLAGGPAEPELLPERLARACVAALPVDGAGLSHAFDPDRRLPLGGSDAQAVVAEQLQFALGDGPCLEAQRRRRPLAVSAAELAERWPVYAGQLAARTGYRSVLAVPVGGPLAAVTTLDLFCTVPEVPAVAAGDVAAVARLVGAALAADMVGRAAPAAGRAGLVPQPGGGGPAADLAGRRPDRRPGGRHGCRGAGGAPGPGLPAGPGPGDRSRGRPPR